MDWVEVNHKVFMGYIADMVILPCSCPQFFYYGTHKHPQAKMNRRRAKYYISEDFMRRG